MAKTFGAESTADEVLKCRLFGKAILVTGVSAGLASDCTLARRARRNSGRHRARSYQKPARPRAAGNPLVDLSKWTSLHSAACAGDERFIGAQQTLRCAHSRRRRNGVSAG